VIVQNTAKWAAAPHNGANDEAPYVKIEGVTKHFGDFTAVDNVSLDIRRGEFFSLLGPSGCGKTTLLRMLAGFETPNEGRILVDGQDVSAIPPHRRPVNMMFQSYALFPHMTVEKNIAFGLKREGCARSEVATRVSDMLHLVQLEKFARRKPHQLSGGQSQRVALARALVKKPKMLLLDEPLAALDKKLRRETQFELVNIQEELGITFIIVTHDQEEAMTVSTRIAVMGHGRIEQIGTPADVYENPESRYVAEFLGEVNVMEGRVTQCGGGTVVLQSEEAGCEMRLVSNVDLSSGASAWVAFRPEKFDVVKADESEAPSSFPVENRMSGEVWDIGYLGNLSIYHIRLDSGRTITVAQTNSSRRTERPITWEDRVHVSWEPAAGVVLVR